LKILPRARLCFPAAACHHPLIVAVRAAAQPKYRWINLPRLHRIACPRYRPASLLCGCRRAASRASPLATSASVRGAHRQPHVVVDPHLRHTRARAYNYNMLSLGLPRSAMNFLEARIFAEAKLSDCRSVRCWSCNVELSKFYLSFMSKSKFYLWFNVELAGLSMVESVLCVSNR
jgi:hypothetical protein